MRTTNSYRLHPEIQRLIARNGQRGFIEGCILLVTLGGLKSYARKIALEYEENRFPSIEALSLVGFDYRLTPDDTGNYLTEQPKTDLSNTSVIVTFADIPNDIPPEYKDAVESILDEMGEGQEVTL